MKINFFEGFTLAYLLVIFVGIVGWVINIFQIINDWTTLSGVDVEIVLRVIGIIVAPLGSIMGLFVW